MSVFNIKMIKNNMKNLTVKIMLPEAEKIW